MKSKLVKFVVSLFSVLLLLTVVFYVFVAVYYQNGFTYGTSVNGVYCTGKTVEKVNSELKSYFKTKTLSISSDMFETEYINLSDIEYEIDYIDGLNSLSKSQNPWLWPANLFREYDDSFLKPDITFSDDKLVSELSSLKLFDEYGDLRKQTVLVKYDASVGYYLYEDITPLVDKERLLECAKDALKGDYSVELQADCFLEREPSKEAIEQRKLWEDLSKVLVTNLHLDMGAEMIPIDSSVLSNFLLLDADKNFVKDESGNFVYDDSKIIEYIDNICDQYNTYKKEREYVTYNGETKHIKLSVYGTEINKKEEEKYFLNAIKTGLSDTHIPKYIHEGFARGLNDIGNTFIEVDMTRQKLLFVSDGELKMECDIVSGRPVAGRETPEVVATVFRKSRNVYLKGDDYISFVKYWMPFYGGDGLHDASWQREFGGERYKRYGSHGCINMRLEDVSELYELVEVGTPIIVYK